MMLGIKNKVTDVESATAFIRELEVIRASTQAELEERLGYKLNPRLFNRPVTSIQSACIEINSIHKDIQSLNKQIRELDAQESSSLMNINLIAHNYSFGE